MQLKWTKPAIHDLVEAGHYIEQHNPQAAKNMSQRVQEAVENLLDFPNIGRPGRVSETKELVVSGTPFIVIYKVLGAVIYIIRVLHHAQQWPNR